MLNCKTEWVNLVFVSSLLSEAVQFQLLKLHLKLYLHFSHIKLKSAIFSG